VPGWRNGCGSIRAAVESVRRLSSQIRILATRYRRALDDPD